MAGGLMISFGPDRGDKGKSPKSPDEGMEGDDDGSPERTALDGLKAALDKDDPALLVKAWKLLQRCCADDSEDEEAPVSERM